MPVSSCDPLGPRTSVRALLHERLHHLDVFVLHRQLQSRVAFPVTPIDVCPGPQKSDSTVNMAFGGGHMKGRLEWLRCAYVDVDVAGLQNLPEELCVPCVGSEMEGRHPLLIG